MEVDMYDDWFGDLLDDDTHLGETIMIDENFDLNFAQQLQQMEYEAQKQQEERMRMDEEMSLKIYLEEQALLEREKLALIKDEELAKALSGKGTAATPILIDSDEIPKPTICPSPLVPLSPSPFPSAPFLPPPKSPFLFEEEEDLESIRLARQIEEEERMAVLAMEESERLAQLLQQEEQRRIEQEKSEQLARRLQKEWEESKAQKDNLFRDDAMLAMMLQEEEEEEKKKAQLKGLQEEDMRIAMEMQKAENTFEEDRKLALKIQKEEEEKKKILTPPPPVFVPPFVAPTPMPYIPFMPRGIKHARLPEPSPQKMAQFSELSKYFQNFDVLKQLIQSYPGGEIRRVIKPQLQERFEKKWESLQTRYGGKSVECAPRIAFHGTKSARMASIENKGLLVPGTSGVSHATDSGWYGRGIYLSPNAGVSLGYSDDGRVIICAVLMGKVFKCTGRMDGAALVPGMDSHESPCGQEYIVFSADQILPLFVLSTRK